MTESSTPSPAPSTIDIIVDSAKAPFVPSASAPHANPGYTAVIYAVVGFLLGRAS